MSLRIALYNLFLVDSYAEQPVHFTQLNSKLFPLNEYVLSPLQSTIEI